MRFFLFLLFSSPAFLIAQSNQSPQKAFNACVDYVNESADRANAIVKSVFEIYPNISRKASWPKYVCPGQMDEYYFGQASSQIRQLRPDVAANLKSAMQALRKADEQLDRSCKALDTYYKLEDYKTDTFQKALSLVTEIQQGVRFFKDASAELQRALQASRLELDKSPASVYKKAEDRMTTAINGEKKILDLWKLNLNEALHTSWPDQAIQQSIATSEATLGALRNKSEELKYPASSMWTNFQESLGSIIDLKKTAIDDYNFEAKKSDKHGNDVYWDFINYYNGTLVADYNTFIQFSERDGFNGLRAFKYVAAFEIRNEGEEAKVTIVPFRDVVHTDLAVKSEKTPITSPVFKSLSIYVDFVNESWRQINYLQAVLRNFSTTAASFRALQNYDKRAPMNFDYSDYKIPKSIYDETTRGSAALPPAYATTLNKQAEVLMGILQELDQQSAFIEQEVKTRKYETDHLESIFKSLARQEELVKAWDDKKEVLYNDLRLIYESFPSSQPMSSWQKSGKVLRDVADLDHKLLFAIKAYYNGTSTSAVETVELDKLVREAIANEYDNMKGIQKIGRNNGLCPYTPYEDLPETSRHFSEAAKTLRPAGNRSGYDHPYHQFVYFYNDVVDDYNKFCELSTTVPHLKTIKEPELFWIASGQANVTKKPVAEKSETPVSTSITAEAKQNETTAQAGNQQLPSIKTIRDTIVVTKTDTVYLLASSEELRSMVGYATNNLFLLLDVSGSMNQPEKLPLLKQSMLNLLGMMRKEDRISIITFASKPKMVLKTTSFKEEDKIRKSVSDLTSSGKTDANAALRFVYKLADENYLRGGNNRIVLATDGDFIVDEQVTEVIKNSAGQDIFLSVFNFGKGMNASKNLERLANIGKGNYQSISRENLELQLIREVKAKRAH